MHKTINYITSSNYFVNTIVSIKNSETIKLKENFISFVETYLLTYGTSILNNRLLMRNYFKIIQNPPLYLTLIKTLFVVTKSFTNEACVLLNYDEISNYFTLDSRNTKIDFKDGSSIIVEVSKHILLNQLAKASIVKSYYSNDNFDLSFYKQLEGMIFYE